MGIQPPSNNSDDDPASIEFGIAALDAVLDRYELDFPVSSAEVIDTLGDEAVPFDPKGNSIQLRKVIAETDYDEFESRQMLLNELHPIFERHRREKSGTILSRLRSLFPF